MIIITRLIRAALNENNITPNKIIEIPMANTQLYESDLSPCGVIERSDCAGFVEFIIQFTILVITLSEFERLARVKLIESGSELEPITASIKLKVGGSELWLISLAADKLRIGSSSASSIIFELFYSESSALIIRFIVNLDVHPAPDQFLP